MFVCLIWLVYIYKKSMYYVRFNSILIIYLVLFFLIEIYFKMFDIIEFDIMVVMCLNWN